ncbi:hypothetical protein CLU79DRAFT_834177 [Phycomyces nitens]|nr:hypothetical protein CLU79DRAFT_834177 [Phycomyces nitens]
MNSATNNTVALAEKLSTIAKRRPRTTPEQSRILNSHFARNPVPSKNEIKLIARENKRASVKREARKAKEKTQDESMPKTKRTRRDPSQVQQNLIAYQQKKHGQSNTSDHGKEDKEKKKVTFYSPTVALYQKRALKLPEMTSNTPMSVQQYSPYASQPRLPPLSSLLAYQSRLPIPSPSSGQGSVMGVSDLTSQLPRVNMQQQPVDFCAPVMVPFFFYHADFGIEVSMCQLQQQRNE